MIRRKILTLIVALSFGMIGPNVYLSAQTKQKDIHELDFQFTARYRNNILAPTWPIYQQNYALDALTASLPRFERFFDKDDVIMSRNGKGLKLTAKNASSKQIFKAFPKIQAPCVLAKVSVNEYSEEHTSMLGFANETNSAILKKINNNDRDEFFFELKQTGQETITQTFSGVPTNGKPYTLYFFLGNDDFRFMIETNEGVKHIGIVSVKRTCFTKKEEFKGFAPAFGVELGANDFATIGAFSAGYFEGIGHADIRSVTYDDGEPVRNERGNFYISTSARFMGKNGGSGGICVYEMDANGRIVRPVSVIVAEDDSWIEAGTAAKLVFDRETEQWLYVARAFPSPGGVLCIGKTKENLLHDGLHLITCKKYEGIVGNSLDGDLIKIDKEWFIAYHGGHPRKLHIAKSKDLETWKEISVTQTGEGIAIARKNGEYFIVDATSPTTMDVRKMFNPSEVVGSIKLAPSPGNHRAHGGFPWGCIIPVDQGDSQKFLMVCFSMDEYIENGSGGIFTYGDIFSYSSF
ncbi:hypothetical protein EYV94_25715 [Puteibacter caeruleilacunae]|nr:hypothetical protein EYV94_25715 [Puteibacter caeruleilacunae]